MFFWGHQDATDGTITKNCLSQRNPAPFMVGGRLYPTAEHWMMAEKARLFVDQLAAEAILAAATPKAAQAMGRKVKNFDHDV